ncbi:hypothetical protein K435DRAFT_672361, partial [Dendrothele bispora CBS 962.96]
VPFGVTYEKIGTIQRRLAWPLHKDDTLSRSGRPTGLNIYFCFCSLAYACQCFMNNFRTYIRCTIIVLCYFQCDYNSESE